jgi:hypothetical protein
MTTIQDLKLEGCTYGISVSGALTLDRATISGGTTAITDNGSPGSTVVISNLLAHSTSDRAIDLFYTGGTISFTTVADAGATVTSGASSVRCGNGLALRSSIVWSAGSALAPIENCGVTSTLAGPVAVPGAMNSNPAFVDYANRDYHLSPSSPARDAVDLGPALDFEGEARPQGARFDIGADEAP